MKILTVAVATTLAAVAPLAAQHEGHAMGSAQVPAMCVLGGMAGGHGEHAAPAAAGGHAQAAQAPAAGGHGEMTLWAHEFMMYQHHAKDFELTAAQTSRIEEIRAAAQASCAHHAHMGMQAKDAATAAFGRAAPDLPTFEAKIAEAHQHMTMAQVAVAKAAMEAFALLTPAQKAKAIAEREEHVQKAAKSAGGHSGH